MVNLLVTAPARADDGPWQIWVVNRDGTGLTNLTDER